LKWVKKSEKSYNSVYLKCLGILGAKDAVMNLKQMESLSNKMEVVELPFEVRG
jgi:hypothetical protein